MVDHFFKNQPILLPSRLVFNEVHIGIEAAVQLGFLLHRTKTSVGAESLTGQEANVAHVRGAVEQGLRMHKKLTPRPSLDEVLAAQYANQLFAELGYT